MPCCKARPAARAAGLRVPFAGWKAILAEDPDDPDVLALAHPNRVNDTFWYLVSRVIQLIALRPLSSESQRA